MDSTNLQITNISHSYCEGGHPTLAELSLSLDAGEIGCLVGTSGCGKTTVLRCIAGFEKITSGKISLGANVVAGESKHVPVEKRKVGLVFQDYALFTHMTVEQNLDFAAGPNASRSDIPWKKQRSDLLDLAELSNMSLRYPRELSGGQQQRLALVRALAANPKILLLDEPFSSLDPILREKLKTDVRAILKSLRMTTLLVTHNRDEAFDLADKVGIMDAGKIEQWGTPRELYTQPRSRKVACALGHCGVIPVHAVDSLSFNSELGVITTKDAKPGARFLLTRPEDIDLVRTTNPAPGDCSAVVECIRYRGAHQLVCCRTTGGSKIQSEVSNSVRVETGDPVVLRYKNPEPVLLSE